MRALRLLWLRRLGIASLVAVALGYLPYRAYDRSGLAHFLRLKGERDRLHQVNLTLGEANLHLHARLDALSDPELPGQLSRAAIERAARDELGLVRPGEIIFRVDPVTEEGSAPIASERAERR